MLKQTEGHNIKEREKNIKIEGNGGCPLKPVIVFNRHHTILNLVTLIFLENNLKGDSNLRDFLLIDT